MTTGSIVPKDEDKKSPVPFGSESFADKDKEVIGQVAQAVRHQCLSAASPLARLPQFKK
jgi:hypothetical protein